MLTCFSKKHWSKQYFIRSSFSAKLPKPEFRKLAHTFTVCLGTFWIMCLWGRVKIIPLTLFPVVLTERWPPRASRCRGWNPSCHLSTEGPLGCVKSIWKGSVWHEMLGWDGRCFLLPGTPDKGQETWTAFLYCAPCCSALGLNQSL